MVTYIMNDLHKMAYLIMTVNSHDEVDSFICHYAITINSNMQSHVTIFIY